MNAVFVVKVVGLILRPICEITGFIVGPNERSLAVFIAESNPALGAIQAMLHVDIFFLVSDTDEVSVMRLAGFLCRGPVLTLLATCVADTIKVRPTSLAHIC